MRVAVASTGDGLDAGADPRFGRCAFFVVVDTGTMETLSVSNTAAMQGSGAGIAAARLVADTGADAVIAANFGPNAYQALSAGGLEVYSFGGGTVRQAVEALIAGGLQKLGDANAASHSGMAGGGAPVGPPASGTGAGGGVGRGMGMGGGMGRGRSAGGGAGRGGVRQVEDVQRQIDGLRGGRGRGGRS